MSEKEKQDFVDSMSDESFMAAVEWVTEQLPGGFFIYRADESQELVFANQAVVRLFGCESIEEFRELTGNSFRNVVHPDDYANVQKSIDGQIADISNYNMDYVAYRILRKDGDVRWVDDYGHLAHLPGVGAVYYVFIWDVTDKRLVERENRLGQAVIEGLSVDFDSIYLINLETGAMRPYRLKNESFNTIIRDVGKDEHGNADWRKVLPEYAKRFVVDGDRDMYLKEVAAERISERLEQEGSYFVGYRIKGPTGDISYMSMSIVLIEGDGEPRRAIMGYRDVTSETKRVQRELAETMKLEMDLEREKQANEMKTHFLFNVSHDIRTPMNAIVGFSDLARRHIGDQERVGEYLEKVDESSKQLLVLIDDLLEMGKIEYGRVDVKLEPCNLQEQVESTVALYKQEADAKHVTLQVDCELPNEEVLADPRRLVRVLGNLVSNAVKFTPDNGWVRVKACQKDVSESGYARYEFVVEDNGVGMSEDFMRRMYETFEREQSSTEVGRIGTGLGLSIAKRLLDVMGGSISVKSKKGEGTTFTVNLPLKLASHANEDAAVQASQAAEAPEPRDEHRILLVEDVEINRMLAETVLEDAGFVVESVPDGCDAVEAVANHPLWYYDLVLMDIQMPVMNGYEATRSIRALGREDTETLPIIALSANARDEDKRMSMESGMNNHIAKPFDVANLIDTVNDHIAARIV